MSSVPKVNDIHEAASPCVLCQVTGEPHREQNVRVTPGDELRPRKTSAPCVMAKSPTGTLPYVPKAAPWAFWHMRQWQCETALISERTSYFTAPHRQLPRKDGVAASCFMGFHEGLVMARILLSTRARQRR